MEDNPDYKKWWIHLNAINTRFTAVVQIIGSFSMVTNSNESSYYDGSKAIQHIEYVDGDCNLLYSHAECTNKSKTCHCYLGTTKL